MFFARAHEQSPPPPERDRARLWSAALGFGALIAVHASLQGGYPVDVALSGILSRVLPISLCAGLIVPSAFRVAMRLPLLPPVRRHHLLIHFAAALALSGLFLLAAASLRALLLADPFNARLSWTAVIRDYVPYFISLFLCYWTVVGAISLRSLQRELGQHEMDRRELQAVALRARLESLRRQLHPHFLFNLLNSISGLVLEGDRRRAVHALSDVSQLLRVSFAREEPFVQLRDELEFLDMFVDLHRLRMGDRVRVEKRVDPAALEMEVPTFLLQPLVENAIEHGVARLEGGGTILVEAAIDHEHLDIRVINSAPLHASRRNGRSRIGLANTRERVTWSYGGRGSFDFSVAGERAVARVRIPVGAHRGKEPDPPPASPISPVFEEGDPGRYARP